MSRPKEDQHTGGTLTIPEGWVVYNVDLDAEEPYCHILDEKGNNETKLSIPKSLAYYLTTHHNGSYKFRELLFKMAKNELRSELKSLLEYKE